MGFAILKRFWVPPVVAATVAGGALAVVNLRGAFGSDDIFSWSGSGSEVIESIHVKQVTYQIFGPGDTAGGVSYLNADTKPEEAHFTSLPWAHTMTTTNPAVVANLVVQGNGDSIGCRIIVNGDVKDEQLASGHHAQAFCLVKAG